MIAVSPLFIALHVAVFLLAGGVGTLPATTPMRSEGRSENVHCPQGLGNLVR
jgi:hypothetical protein